MYNLKRLDLSGHPEFFMCEEAKEAHEFSLTLGISKEQRKNVTFSEYNIKILDILGKLDRLEELICDEDLEAFILQERNNFGFLPQLRLLNEVSIEVTDVAERKKISEVVKLFNNL